jgi:hypothetical protein
MNYLSNYIGSKTVTVDFNSLFTEMFRTSEVRCEVQKFIMKFTNRFVKLAVIFSNLLFMHEFYTNNLPDVFANFFMHVN